MTAELATNNATAIAVQASPMSARDITEQVVLIQEVMRSVMREGEHYGKVPGCGDKPALLKPGAEKLGLTFHLVPSFRIKRNDLPNGHREYELVCELRSPGGHLVGEGVGCCSTLEKKYRWRGGARLCPTCGGAFIKKSKYPPRNDPHAPPGFYCFAKLGGCGQEFAGNDPAIIEQSEERQENPDIADQYNTVLKMAKKRAHVDAILTATAASDIFTQDIEELLDDRHQHNGPATNTVVDAPARETVNNQSPQQTPPAESPEQVKARAAMSAGKWLAAIAAAPDEAALRKLWDDSRTFRTACDSSGFHDLVEEMAKAKDQRKATFAAQTKVAPATEPAANTNGTPATNGRPRPPIPF